MELAAANSVLTLPTVRPTGQDKSVEAPNAFGIGNTNKPEVELSPQARILQQNEQDQTARQQGLGKATEQRDDTSNSDTAISGNEFVRVSSSVGTAAKNNLTTDKATEVYRSIQELL